MNVDTQKMRIFWIIIITQTFSLLGSQMSGFAVGIKIYNDTQQATPLALVALFGAIPRLVSANLAGLLADRWNRKKVMILADVGQAVATLLLLISFASGKFELWHLYGTTILSSMFGVFQMPAFSATITMLVPDERRNLANTVQQLQGRSAGIIAPVIAAFLFVAVGVTGVLVVDLLTFAVAVGVLSQMAIPQPEPTLLAEDEPKPSLWQNIWAGFQFVFERRPLLYAILYATFLNFMFSMTGVLFTPYILTLTDNNEALLGTLTGLMSAGSILGGVLFGFWHYKGRRVYIFYSGIIFTSLMLALLGVARSPVMLGIVMFLIILPNPATNAVFMSLLQIKTPPDLQGRVIAFVLQLAMLATPLAFLMAGPLTDDILEPAVGTGSWALVEPLVGNEPGAGMGLLMLINGTLMVLVGLIIFASPTMRNLEENLPDYVPVAKEEDLDDNNILMDADDSLVTA